MPLADRDYMRDPQGMPWSMTARLLALYLGTFALQCLNEVYLRSPLESWLALTAPGLRSGWLWQVFTYQFLHADLLHVVFNSIAFWWLGRFAEEALGVGRFLLLLLGGGVAGGILQGVLMVLFPAHFGTVVFGASAGVAALFALFALLQAEAEVRLYFILPVRARTLLWISLAVAGFFTLVPSPRSGIAHAAHLGGLLAGLAFVRLGWHHDYQPLPGMEWWRNFRSARTGRVRRIPLPRPNPVAFPAVSTARPRQPPNPNPPLPAAEFISREVDPILEKIAAHGIQSLTDREKQILEAARQRITRR